MVSPASRTAALASAFERNVLLIDGVETRQLARAAAMRQAGATVQCVASGEAARAVWKPGSHQLILIELDGAGPDAREFYDYARALNARQAFAFYTNEPPYLRDVPGKERQRASARAEKRGAKQGTRMSFAEASEQMAAARASGRMRREAVEAPAPSARPSFAEAVKAAEAAAKSSD